MAIYENKLLIDKEVDAGDMISIIPTEIYKTDSLEILSRRHYSFICESFIKLG
ncbi:MAG: hypothetical protein JJV95_01925 [Sulfurospirillum sp.]|nr:hypothetical protein [Sulfurospirillum sp.]